MPCAIMQFKKIAASGINLSQRHNERRKFRPKDISDSRYSRYANDYHIINSDMPYTAFIHDLIGKVGCRTRKNSVLMVETVLSASPGFLINLSPIEQQIFFQHAVSFFKREIGQENIISAVVHTEERAPHMHLGFVPLTKDNRLSAKEIVGNRQKLCLWQDKYYEHMNEKFPCLQRGLPAMDTLSTHTNQFVKEECNEKRIVSKSR